MMFMREKCELHSMLQITFLKHGFVNSRKAGQYILSILPSACFRRNELLIFLNLKKYNCRFPRWRALAPKLVCHATKSWLESALCRILSDLL